MGHDHIKWKNEPEINLVSRNLRREGESTCFCREPANICTSRNEFFLNNVIPIWNDLPQKIRETKSVNCFKAGLNGMELFKT